MMIGFYFADKGYNLWDPKMKNVIISRSVKFDEGNISVHVDIEEQKTNGIGEVRTVPTVGIQPPVELVSPSVDYPEGANDNPH